LIGYTKFKTTKDSGSALSPALDGVKDPVFALGPEFNITWPKQRIILTARSFAQFEARDRTQGQGFTISLAYVGKSLVPPPPAAKAP
jgi:hypothetical protein